MIKNGSESELVNNSLKALNSNRLMYETLAGIISFILAGIISFIFLTYNL